MRLRIAFVVWACVLSASAFAQERHPALKAEAEDVSTFGASAAQPYLAYCSEPFATDPFKRFVFELASLDTQPVLSNVLDPEQTQAIIQQVRDEIAVDAIENPEMQAYLESLIKTIIPYSPRMLALGDDWKLHLTEKPLKYNALAALGGTFVFDLSYLKTLKTEAELVGVLAHEIGHIEYAHSESSFILMRLLAQREDFDVIFNLINEGLQPKSSLEERAADVFALQVMVSLGYDPLAFAEVFRRTADKASKREAGHSFGKFLADEVSNLQQDHPRDDVRVCAMIRQLEGQGLLEEDTVYYLGKTNFEKHKPRSEQQF